MEEETKNKLKPLATKFVCQLFDKPRWPGFTHLIDIIISLVASPFHSAPCEGKGRRPWILQARRALKRAWTWPCVVQDQQRSCSSILGCSYSLSRFSQQTACKAQWHLPLSFQDCRKCNYTKPGTSLGCRKQKRRRTREKIGE